MIPKQKKITDWMPGLAMLRNYRISWLRHDITAGLTLAAMLVLSPVRTIVFGLMIVLFLIFEPHGLAEVWRRIRRLFHLWPFRT